jgi:CRISPR system Cascade subunit CasD
MGRPVLLMRLEGVWQAWGTRARWDVRDTQLEPTKSGVVGLLGCALGYPMHDVRLQDLAASLRFGVRVESPGRVVRDYQTVSDFLPTAEGTYKLGNSRTVSSLDKARADSCASPATIISPRYYLEDASFLVAMEQCDGGDLTLIECEQALLRPKWPVFLGRKACVPTRPVLEKLTTDYDDIEDALKRHPWSWMGAGADVARKTNRPKTLVLWMEDESGPYVRQDSLRINPARVYEFRHAKRLEIPWTEEMIADVSIKT